MDSIATLKQKKILVLSGGWSAERDISLKSGIAVSKALQENDILHTHVAVSYTHLTLPTNREV